MTERIKMRPCQVCGNPYVARGPRHACSELCRLTLRLTMTSDKDCWGWWPDGDSEHNGYAVFTMRNPKRVVRAHRAAYELLVGPIPDGLELDHLCRNKTCVNPDHLEPVTHKENVQRDYRSRGVGRAETHCVNGHEWNEENTRFGGTSGRRWCGACAAI